MSWHLQCGRGRPQWPQCVDYSKLLSVQPQKSICSELIECMNESVREKHIWSYSTTASTDIRLKSFLTANERRVCNSSSPNQGTRLNPRGLVAANWKHWSNVQNWDQHFKRKLLKLFFELSSLFLVLSFRNSLVHVKKRQVRSHFQMHLLGNPWVSKLYATCHNRIWSPFTKWAHSKVVLSLLLAKTHHTSAVG